VAAPTDAAPGGAEQPQDQAEHDQEDPEPHQEVQRGQKETEDQQDDAENDHALRIPKRKRPNAELPEGSSASGCSYPHPKEDQKYGVALVPLKLTFANRTETGSVPSGYSFRSIASEPLPPLRSS
jgi:hypothetical protein